MSTTDEMRKMPGSRISFNRRQVISKMMSHQSEKNECNEDPPNNAIQNKKDLMVDQIAIESVPLKASTNALITSQGATNIPMQLEKDRNKAKNKQNLTHTEFSEDESEDNERNGRLPSRCNSERMSQKYDASEEKY